MIPAGGVEAVGKGGGLGRKLLFRLWGEEGEN